MRIVAFNPRLKLNDGLLVQSYMALNKVGFAEAMQLLEKEVNRTLSLLRENGSVTLENIGELHYSIRGTYSFKPFDYELSAPGLYGLGSFEMQKLKPAESNKGNIRPNPVATPQKTGGRRPLLTVKLRPSHLTNIAAMIAVVAMFFLLPGSSIKNTEIASGNYAQLLPEELFEKIEQRSLAINPILVRNVGNDKTTAEAAHSHIAGKEKGHIANAPAVDTIPQKAQSNLKEREDARKDLPFSVSTPKTPAVHKGQTTTAKGEKDVKLPKTSPAVKGAKRYHVIVASVSTERDAREMAHHLQSEGHEEAQAIIGNGKMRVSITSCTTESEAYRYVNELRKDKNYQTAWVLKK